MSDELDGGRVIKVLHYDSISSLITLGTASEECRYRKAHHQLRVPNGKWNLKGRVLSSVGPK